MKSTLGVTIHFLGRFIYTMLKFLKILFHFVQHCKVNKKRRKKIQHWK